MLAELDRLAESCDAGTKVVVIGHINDVVLYRELLKRGVSEYLIAPIDAAAADGEPVQSLQQSRHRSGRPRHRLHRRQGRRRLEHGLPQRRLGAVGDPQVERRHRRSRPRLRHHRPRLQPGSRAGHRRGAAEPGASRRGAARPPADQVLGASEHLRRAGRARPRLRHLARRLRHRARRRAPERALRRRRSAAHLDAVGRSACCCRPTRSSSPPCPISPTCATPRTSSIC